MKKIIRISLIFTAIRVAVKVVKTKRTTAQNSKSKKHVDSLNKMLSHQVDILQENNLIMQEWFVKEIEKNAVSKYRLLTKED